jgi:hypothetical protein
VGTKIVAHVHLSVDNLSKLVEALNVLESREVMVGWPADKDKPRKQGDPMKNFEIAYLLDKGSAMRNLPAQPALGPGIEEGREKIVGRLRDAGKVALDGNIQGVEKNFIAAGVDAVSAVRNKIDNGPWKKLADSTIARRRAKGFMGTKRYIFSGQLRNAVNFSVRKRKR